MLVGVGPLYILIFLWKKETYVIENVRVDDLINIIIHYFQKNSISYEIKSKDIYLPEYEKTIKIIGKYEINIDLKEIKELSFYKEFIETIKYEIKKTERKIFPILGGIYLIYAGVFYWFMIFIQK